MKKVIRLESVKCINIMGGGINVHYAIKIDGAPHTLSYKIYARGVSNNIGIDTIPVVCDTVVVSLLYDMMTEGYDFESEIPISPKLYHNLTRDLMPHLIKMNLRTLTFVNLKVPILQEKIEQKEKWVGTGVSCGVDSFTAIKEFSNNKIEDYKLTHLLYFKVGAHHGLHYPCPEDIENKIFEEELEVANNFCKQNGYELIVIDSNINQLGNKIWGVEHTFAHVALFRNIGAMLILQAYFSKYLLATAYASFSDFSMNIKDGIEHNMWWSTPLLGSENLEVIPAGSTLTRVEKTQYISDFKPAYDNLMVCWKGVKNCGECSKCIRTLVTLDFLGVIDRFEKSFDLDKYRKNKKKYLENIVYSKSKDTFYREIYEYAKANNIYLPGKFISYLHVYSRFIKNTSFLNIFKAILSKFKIK